MNESAPRSMDRSLRQARLRALLRLIGHWTIRIQSALLLGFALAMVMREGFSFRFTLPAWGDPELGQRLTLVGIALLSSLPLIVILVARYRSSPQGMALRLDRHFDLKERLTTAVGLTESERASPMGRAVLRDAEESMAKVRVPEAFPLTPSWQGLWLPLAAMVCLGAILFCHATPDEPQPKSAFVPLSPNEEKALSQTLDKLKGPTPEGEEPFPPEDLKGLQGKLDDLTRRPPKTEEEARELLKDLTAMADRLDKKSREQEKAREALRERMQEAARLSRKRKEGPADKLREALEQAEMERAEAEARRLSRKLQEDQLSEQERADLAEQLRELEEQLQDLADSEEMQKLIEEMGRNGERMRVERVRLEKVAGRLREARGQLEEGDKEAAARALSEAGDKMGEGQGQGQALAEKRILLEKARILIGRGLGSRGRGGAKGLPGEEPEGMSKEEWLKGNRERGSVTGFRHIPGQGVRGPTTPAEARTAVESAGREAAEALERQHLPSSAKKLARGYYERLRKK